jgi:amino acid permease
MTGKKQLTFLEATAIITGYGIGGGIMTVPYLTTKTGLPAMFVLLIVGFLISLIMHLMVAEVMLRDGQGNQMVELFQKYLLKNKPAIFTWVLFGLLAFAFLMTLSAYIAGGGEIISKLFSIPMIAGQLIFYVIAAGVVFYGLKVLGIAEKYAVFMIIGIVGVLAVGSAFVPFSLSAEIKGTVNNYLALFGMIMFSFFAIFSVPQIAEGLDWNKKLIPKAITLGIVINAFVIISLVVLTIGVSGGLPVEKVAIITLGTALGPWANITGSLFVLLAMLTSYWSVSFALAVVVEERVKTNPKMSWLIATLPSFVVVLALVSKKGFLDYLVMAGGAIALLVAFMVVPLLNSARKIGNVTEPEWHLGIFGGRIFQLIVILGFILMAVGSVMPQ